MIITKSSLALSPDDVLYLVELIVSCYNSKQLLESQLHLRSEIIYHQIHGTPTSSSQYLESQLALPIPEPTIPIPRDSGPAIVAVYDQSIEMPSFGFNSNDPNSISIEVVTDSTNSFNSFHDLNCLEVEVMENFVCMLWRSNVTVLVSQRLIHQYVQRLCHSVGIICIPSVSSIYIGVLLRISGAKQLGAFQYDEISTQPIRHRFPTEAEFLNRIRHSYEGNQSVIEPSCLGYIQNIDMIESLNNNFIIVHGSDIYNDSNGQSTVVPIVTLYCSIAHHRRRFCANIEQKLINNYSKVAYNFDPSNEVFLKEAIAFADGFIVRFKGISTLFVASFTETMCEELQHVIETIVASLSTLIQESAVALPGCGCWQSYVAEEISASVDKRKMNLEVREAVRIYSTSLSECASIISLGPKKRLMSNTLHHNAKQRPHIKTVEFIASGNEDIVYDNDNMFSLFIGFNSASQRLIEEVIFMNQIIDLPVAHILYQLDSDNTNNQRQDKNDGLLETFYRKTVCFAEVLDIMPVCMNALDIATEIALTIFDIDGICVTNALQTSHTY
jgi:hypothetical protein